MRAQVAADAVNDDGSMSDPSADPLDNLDSRGIFEEILYRLLNLNIVLP